MGLVAVRDGLKTAISTVTTLRVHDTVPEQINPPAAIIRLANPVGQPHSSFAGHATWFFEVEVLVQLGTFRTAQDELDAYLDPSGVSSIVAAIEAAPTLSATCENLMIGAWRDYDTVRYAGGDYLRAILDVEVWVTY